MTTLDHHRAAAVEAARAADEEDFWQTLLPEAATLAVHAGYVSARMLTRKMRVGHDLACQLVDELVEAGVVEAGEAGDDLAALVGPGDLAEVLAGLAGDEPGEPATPDLADDLAPQPGGSGGTVVDLVKHQPATLPPAGGDLMVRPDNELAIPDWDQPPPLLVTRIRQASARAWVRVVDEPVVTRTVAVTIQAPRAGARLMIWTPRGARRACRRTWDWLNDAETLRLLAKHEEAGEGESYARVADARAKKNLAGRRALVITGAALATLVALAWWAPTVFAGVLAVLAFAGVVAVTRSSCRDPRDLALVVAAAGALAGLAWWQGPDLAALVPQPPAWVWWVLALILVVLFGLLGRQEDQKLVEMPANMAPHKPPPVTAPMIVEALFRIGVAGMTANAADKGMREEVRVRAPGVGRAKHGWQIELELPPGITAGDVGEKREELAGALRRPLGCVWPSGGGDHPGHLRIYLGDKPMATAQQTEWPLASGAPIDIFNPFPLFTDEEGRWVDVTLLGTHAVVAGASGFGKSVTLRQLAVACALDPRVRLYVFDGKISGDLAPLQKVAHAYYEGAEPEDIAEQLTALQGIEQEMRRRAKFLRSLPADQRSPKVTSALADRYPHLSPIVLLIDEVQEYTEYGVKGSKEDKAIRDAFVASLTRISRLGRSAGIAKVLVTQKPDAFVIPTAIMGNCSIRVCHKVTEQNHNDQVLGTSAYKNGYNAALFSQEDRGLAWLRAEGDPRVVRSWSEMVDLDTAAELVDKAWALRRGRGLLTGQAADDGIEDAEIVYSLPEDAEHVMTVRGCGKAQWGELTEWLREYRPAQYGELAEAEVSAAIRTAVGKPRDVRSGDSVRKGVYLSDLRKRGSGDDDE